MANNTKSMADKRQVSSVTNVTAEETPKSKKTVDQASKSSERPSSAKQKKSKRHSKSKYVKKTGLHFNEQEDIQLLQCVRMYG